MKKNVDVIHWQSQVPNAGIITNEKNDERAQTDL